MLGFIFLRSPFLSRLSTIAEHHMIRRAIDRGVSKERLAGAFNVNLSSINRRINLLEGMLEARA